MKILADTSVLVAALAASHIHHTRARPWLKAAEEKRFELGSFVLGGVGGRHEYACILDRDARSFSTVIFNLQTLQHARRTKEAASSARAR